MTRHQREVARVVPTVSSAVVIPPKRSGPSRTVDLTRVELPDGAGFDDFLADLKGES